MQRRILQNERQSNQYLEANDYTDACEQFQSAVIVLDLTKEPRDDEQRACLYTKGHAEPE